ncbi:MAG: flagellar biosynthetic protein FliR, partial [Phycisphaerae bacterium]
MPTELMTFSMLLPAWLLVVARVAGLVLAVPMFSSSAVPTQFRVMLVIAIAAMVFPVVLPKLHLQLGFGQLVAGIAGELLIGVILGLGASVVFLAAQLGGQFVAQQAGLSLGAVFNPVFEANTTALQQVWFFVMMAAFIALGGDRAVLSILLSSFDLVPPLLFGDGLRGDAADALLPFAVTGRGLTCELAVRLAGPALVGLLLSSAAIGFLVRTMPQFNVLMIGFS